MLTCVYYSLFDYKANWFVGRSLWEPVAIAAASSIEDIHFVRGSSNHRNRQRTLSLSPTFVEIILFGESLC